MPTRAMPALTDPLLSWALWYGAMGWPIFPCHTPKAAGCSCPKKAACDSMGKHPRITGWQQRATTDPDQIEKWWGSMFPQANIGLATGHTGWVLDVDPTKGGALALEALIDQHGPLPPTPLTHTGGYGFHHHLQLPPTGSIGNRVNFCPGLDTRALGGLVILPPSLHASGRHYSWDSDHDLDNTPLAPTPDWLVTLIQHPQASSQPPLADDAPIVDGVRNKTLSDMAFAIRKAGMSFDGVLAALLAENARCVPPLTPDEIAKIVEGKKAIHPDPVWVFTTPGSNGTHPAGGTPPAWPPGTRWETLRTTQYPLHKWHIKGLMRHGMSIMGGAPKAAKSYIAYDIALSTAGQGLALGYWGCTPGGVLYCAVEDDEADSKDRVFELRPCMPDTLASPFIFVNMDDVPLFSQDLCGYIRHMVRTHALSLVVIDPLMYVYDLAIPRGKDPFQALQAALLPFRQLAVDEHFALLFVDHRRKSSRDDIDIFETLYGSRAKEAIADTLLMVERHEHELTITTKGRKIDDRIFHFGFAYDDTTHTFTWSFDGVGAHVISGARQRLILQAFSNAHLAGQFELDARGVIDFAEAQQSPALYNSIRQGLFQLRRKGTLVRARNGLFVVVSPGDLPPPTADDPGIVV